MNRSMDNVKAVSAAKYFCVLLSIWIFSLASFAADVEGVRLWRAPDHTRVVFDLAGPVDHKIFQLQQPSRLVIDIDNSRNNASLASVDLSKTPIKRIRSAARDQKDLRFVFDLQADIKPRSFCE